MNFKLQTLGLVFLASITAQSQVASHAPTIFPQSPAKPGTSATSNPSGKPVARVNNAILTDTDLVREEYAIFPYAKQHGGLPKDLASQIRDGALKMIVFEELVYQEAQRRNLTVSAVRMQKAEADFRKQFQTPAEFNAFLQSDFQGSRELLQQKIRRSLLIEALLKTEVEQRSVVSPVELRAFYDKNPARFQHPETYTFQTISILPPAKGSLTQLKEGRARAEDALKQAKAAKTSRQFGLLAEKISDDDYRVMMGQHKPLPVNEIAPEVLKALHSMKPGAISDVIQIEQAYTIVHFQAHAPAGKVNFLEVKTQLAKELHETKRNQLRIELDQKLRKNAKIQEM